MNTIEHLRGIAALRPLRGRRPAVVVCADDGERWERHRGQLAALDGELVVESEPGPLSQRLGRPSVTVTDRFLEVMLRGEELDPDDVLKTVRWLEMRCEECPQSGVDMAVRGPPATRASRLRISQPTLRWFSMNGSVGVPKTHEPGRRAEGMA